MSRDEPDKDESQVKSEEKHHKEKFERFRELARLREFRENMDFVYKVILIGLYGNWVLTFIDNMNIAFTDETRLYVGAEAIAATILLVSLILYFLNRTRKMMAIHVFSIVAITGIELVLNPNQLKIYILFILGLILWLSIDNLPFITQRIIHRTIKTMEAGNEEYNPTYIETRTTAPRLPLMGQRP